MQRFSSKIDSWILISMLVAIAGQVIASVALLTIDGPAPGRVPGVVLLLLGTILVVSILVRTNYTIAGDRLRIVSGPFAWSIALSEITGITESRSPLSSPALSLDRLQIEYRDGKRILVSPADKKGFLEALDQFRP